MEFPARRFLLLCCLFPAMTSQAVQPDTVVIPAAPDLNALTPSQRGSTSAEEKRQTVTNQTLQNQPAMAGALLNQAVEQQQWPVVKGILPVYQSSPQADPLLVMYAQAGLARNEGKLTEAAVLYREMLSQHPDLVPVRLDLARTLFEDRQYEAAAWNFQQARAGNPPPAVQENINHYLSYIQNHRGWVGNLSLSYLNDSNVNNASDGKTIRIGDRLFERDPDSYPKRGEGIYYGGTLQRDFNQADHHNIRFRTTLSGKSYWNNHAYDDIISRAYLGYVYQDARQQLALLPFYEKRWYGTAAYSYGAGVRGEFSYLIAADWQLSQAVEYQQLSYDSQDYRYLRGDNRLLSTTLAHAINSRLSLFGGIDIGEQKTQLASETHQRVGGRFGLQTALPYGISMGAMASFAQRRYQAENDIFQQKRQDKEQLYALSLWHRDLYFFNLMPKINVIYKRIDSNIDFYRYDTLNVFLSVDREF
ncbi:porin family protein [Winslowiella iniecta]|uniref:Uncharacterized protein n=1 Tax=Winslowiella iniecta TaxID=1560201 RepID=A0A0L7T2D9_9GAMM|nr:porin family protein [Winslowiella iniecta]KOC89386.1 hypothetical protein NG42_12530 [Winslowiella iniecta]KOC93404.1 hypothetical protein NG43_10195 [Winslowiella iniecta]